MLELGPGQCWSYARPMLELCQANAGVLAGQCWSSFQGKAGVRASEVTMAMS